MDFWLKHLLQTKFPFPSNGKVYRKDTIATNHFKADWSFHSLQTGKCIARDKILKVDFPDFWFPFPSNGKVYRKLMIIFSSVRFRSRFHSLQTGKCIASFRAEYTNLSGGSFHSLQTGKCIAREAVIREARNLLLFPFPSNGKVYRKFNMAKRWQKIKRWFVSIPFKRESVSQEI